MTTKTVKEIKVDVDKCTGCRACEMACSAFHASPKYSIVNPARSRIHVIIDESRDVYVPVRAGDYAQAECNGRNKYIIAGKEYNECSFCSASCPSRNYFKEPDSGLPLKCDMCESIPPIIPMCVQACKPECLTYEEHEVEEEEEEKPEEIEVGLDSLMKKYGVQAVMDTVTRLQQSKP